MSVTEKPPVLGGAVVPDTVGEVARDVLGAEVLVAAGDVVVTVALGDWAVLEQPISDRTRINNRPIDADQTKILRLFFNTEKPPYE